ncbi:MAG TPA: response regulator [Spirochaetota bacterium]|nr:response regulator [Spirochaetota bacterium]HPS87440.1 response regulator [Spirochaetota bacterium]
MNKRKILVADDDYDIIASMLVILKSKGHDVATAGSGEEALVKFAEFKPDIIFLDLMMEKFDSGVTVCKKIRETDKNVKIYLISAVGNETADIPEAHEMGFNGSMSKPITPEELLGLVD